MNTNNIFKKIGPELRRLSLGNPYSPNYDPERFQALRGRKREGVTPTGLGGVVGGLVGIAWGIGEYLSGKGYITPEKVFIGAIVGGALGRVYERFVNTHSPPWQFPYQEHPPQDPRRR